MKGVLRYVVQEAERNKDFDPSEYESDISPAIAELGFMINHQRLLMEVTEEKNERAVLEKELLQMEELRNKALTIVYSETVDPIPEQYLHTEGETNFNARLLRDFQTIDRALRRTDLQGFDNNPEETAYGLVTTQDGTEPMALARELTGKREYKEILNMVDTNITVISDWMRTRSWKEFNDSLQVQEEPRVLSDKGKQALDAAAEQVYKLTLLKQALEKKIYERNGLSKEDKDKIDEVRSGINAETASDIVGAAERESVTRTNIAQYKDTQARIDLGGEQWQFSQHLPETDEVVLERPASVAEATDILDKAIQAVREGKTPSVVTGNTRVKAVKMKLTALLNDGEWVLSQKPRSKEDPERIKDLEAAKKLQSMITTISQQERELINQGGAMELAIDVLTREADKLRKELQS